LFFNKFRPGFFKRSLGVSEDFHAKPLEDFTEKATVVKLEYKKVKGEKEQRENLLFTQINYFSVIVL